MTKPESGLFKGTSGIEDFYGDAERVIAERVKNLDLTPHPVTQKQLSSKQCKRIKSRIEDRTATKDEYKRYMWNTRFSRRKRAGINNFWSEERGRIMNSEPWTRDWSDVQIEQILNKGKPTHLSKSLEAHHTYSAKNFPHLSNLGAVIYPATHNEHLKGWHGGNYRKSLPGKRIKRYREI